MKHYFLGIYLLLALVFFACNNSNEDEILNPGPQNDQITGNLSVFSTQFGRPENTSTNFSNFSYELALLPDTNLTVNFIEGGKLINNLVSDAVRRDDKVYFLRFVERQIDVMELGGNRIAQSIDYSSATSVSNGAKRLAFVNQNAIVSDLNYNIGIPFLIKIDLEAATIDSMALSPEVFRVTKLAVADNKLFLFNLAAGLFVLDGNTFQELQKFADKGFLRDSYLDPTGRLLAVYEDPVKIDPTDLTFSESVPSSVNWLSGPNNGLTNVQSTGYDSDNEILYYIKTVNRPKGVFVISSLNLKTNEEIELNPSFEDLIEFLPYTFALDTNNHLLYVGGLTEGKGMVKVFDTKGRQLRELPVEGVPFQILTY